MFSRYRACQPSRMVLYIRSGRFKVRFRWWNCMVITSMQKTAKVTLLHSQNGLLTKNVSCYTPAAKVGDYPHMLLPVKYLPQSQFSAGDVVKSLHKTYCHFSFPCMSKSCRKPRRNCIHLLPAEMYISVQNKPYKKSPMQTLYVTDCG